MIFEVIWAIVLKRRPASTFHEARSFVSRICSIYNPPTRGLRFCVVATAGFKRQRDHVTWSRVLQWSQGQLVSQSIKWYQAFVMKPTSKT